MFAARVGDLESARLLVAAGANVNDADAWGISALVMAAHSGFGDLVEFLLEKARMRIPRRLDSPHCTKPS
jgi:ankyrin repeat protein